MPSCEATTIEVAYDRMIKKYSMTYVEKDKLIDRIASYLETECPDIKVAYLFGSFASNVYFADIDIGLLLELDNRNVLTYEFNVEHALEKIIKLPVDIRVLNRAPLSFCYNVIKSKNVLLDRDSNFRAEFESRTLRQYFDFLPFQKRYLAEVVNAPI